VTSAFRIVLVAATTVAFAFLFLPVVAIFLRISPGQLVAQLGSPVAVDALVVSMKTSVIAHVVIVGVGTPSAYLLGTRRFPGRRFAIALVELPLVLPPAVAGIALLAAFGRRGLLGEELAALGITLPFTQVAVVLAIVFVASPFYLRQAIAAFEAIDPAVVDASRTLGAGPFRTFRRVALPLAATGLGAGSALAWARGFGEFGATIMFAGNLQGVTQTLPLAVYAQLDQDFDLALAIGGLLVVVSAGLLLGVKLLPAWERFVSISPSRSATSSSPSR
jgi:molybdate transport system permease protein